MMKVVKELMYRGRFKKLYELYDTGQIGWNEYTKRLRRLNKKYEN